MPILQLRNHIPIGAPARREPTDGAEPPIRVSLGFSPGWYHQRCGVEFSERWHIDPYYRHAATMKMKAAICASFSRANLWDLNQAEDTWSLSGIHHAFVIPAVFGCAFDYPPNGWAMIVARPDRSLEEFANLTVEQVLACPVVENLFEQMDVIEREGGKIHGYLGWQGVLNNAFNIYGQNIFVDMVERPDLTHRFFALITDVMITLMRQVQGRQRRSGFQIDQGDISNCVMNMISPRMYREFVFQYDQKMAASFERFGVHTCNWNATPYLADLADLPNMGYLDMGIMSDLKQARALFPESRCAVMYSPQQLQDSSSEKILSDMWLIREDLAPCDIVAGDIQPSTPDARVKELLDVCRSLE